MTQIILSTEEVLDIAKKIETDNEKLLDLLNESKKHLDYLSSYWSGEASAETLASYDSFANKFFQQYHDILAEYVNFLRINVADDYDTTERADIKLADAFN